MSDDADSLAPARGCLGALLLEVEVVAAVWLGVQVVGGAWALARLLGGG